MADNTSFSIPHLEFSDHGEPRATQHIQSAGSFHQGEDDVHFHRHTSETRELYGQMFSELGIPKLRSLAVGPSLPSHRVTFNAEPVPRVSSPIPRSTESSILSPPHHHEAGKRSMAPRPVSPGGSISSGIHPLHHTLHGQSILTVDMFSKEQLNAIFNLAQTFRLCVQKERSLDHVLKVSRIYNNDSFSLHF